MGTVFFLSGATKASQSRRSSSQSRTLRKRLVSGIAPAPGKDFIAAHLDVEGLQRAGRRSRDVAAIQGVGPVVTRAPDLVKVVAILHRTGQVGARGRHRPVLAGGSADQQAGPAAKAEYLPGVRFQLPDPPGYNRIAAQVGGLGGNQVAQDGIDTGD